jgi:hypothetical protein
MKRLQRKRLLARVWRKFESGAASRRKFGPKRVGVRRKLWAAYSRERTRASDRANLLDATAGTTYAGEPEKVAAARAEIQRLRAEYSSLFRKPQAVVGRYYSCRLVVEDAA